MQNSRILFIDDDKNFLSGIHRSLFRRFDVTVVDSPIEGLELMDNEHFSVVISDLKMPQMGGIEFLSQIRLRHPDTVRVLFTGFSDQQTAIDAVNHGEIFRFLTKPCNLELLIRVLQDSIRQYQLLVSERELVEKTLFGAIDLLSQVLSLTNPLAQGQSKRLKFYSGYLAERLGYSDRWFFEMSAMLSKLGCLIVPGQLFEKYLAEGEVSEHEAKLMNNHPCVAEELLLNIPRMDDIAKAVSLQNTPYTDFSTERMKETGKQVATAAQLLHVLNEYDRLLNIRHCSLKDTVKRLRDNPHEYNPDIVSALELLQSATVQYERVSVGATDLTLQMKLVDDVFTSTGVKLAASGQELTDFMLIGIRNYAKNIGVKEPFTVLAPIAFVDQFLGKKGGSK